MLALFCFVQSLSKGMINNILLITPINANAMPPTMRRPKDSKDVSLILLFEVWQRRGDGCWCWYVRCDWTGWYWEGSWTSHIWEDSCLEFSELDSNQPYHQPYEVDGISDIPLLTGLLSSVERRNYNQISLQTNNEPTQACTREEMLEIKIKLNQRLCFPN